MSLWCRLFGHKYAGRKKYLGELKPGSVVYCKDPRQVTLETHRSIDPLKDVYVRVYEDICEREEDGRGD